MLLYKIDVELDENINKHMERSEERERAYELQSEIEEIFRRQDYSFHVSVSSITYHRQKAVLSAAFKDEILTDNVIEEFLAETDIKYKQFSISEITLEAYLSLLRTASNNDFISDTDDIIDKFNITQITRGRFGRKEYIETILYDIATKDTLITKANDMLCGCLAAEVERVYKGSLTSAIFGHPVHYLIQTDDKSLRTKMLKTLLSALFQNNRIKSRRYAEIHYNGERSIRHDYDLKSIFEAGVGGSLVACFDNECEEGEYATNHSRELLIEFCEMAREYRNRVLSVFCFPKSSKSLQTTLMENTEKLTLVPLSDEMVFDDRAREHLRNIAKNQGIKPPKALYKNIEAGKGYSSANLSLMFDEWYDRHLKTKVYTQYADFESANKKVAASKPKGSAFEELTKMVGLKDAKDVIAQALDFYKAQKLFGQKGFISQRPAMHMIFTGNPGTAKTSVARLFAQIMKDNGLLSKGDLYEVGRSDLVGKYVGWTAQIVKQKFKEAKGSVLFIDEAYSLVEAKNGLYGDEAINTIVMEMENSREDTIVIFAGYPDKMEGFIQKNPGLRSRIAFHVPFADYSADELCQITELIAENKNMKLDEPALGKLAKIFKDAMRADDFGNGRFARNMFEKAVMKQASRLVAMDVDKVTIKDIEKLMAEDFEVPKTVKKETKFGF